jgi:hypothetical protein
MPTKSTAKRPKKRKTRRRPVLQFRVYESEYRRLAEAATKHGLTISEEAARRLSDYGLRESIDAMAEKYKLLTEEAESQLERSGYHKIQRDIWVGPSETDASVLTVSQLEELLVKAAKLGAELALKD